ncbi:hypothetical protein SAMN06269250_3945 [Spirosoma fluviale]|uniref:Uncharacterized protein n=1 Tax=Spirosoma fluviale TaxID=1597977 RepID=A0A286GA21_9BACT|nr:hypothetical protein SAMN06269250_3945 [Spirosoma fluviale]
MHNYILGIVLLAKVGGLLNTERIYQTDSTNQVSNNAHVEVTTNSFVSVYCLEIVDNETSYGQFKLLHEVCKVISQLLE